jgi:hypothetical protein
MNYERAKHRLRRWLRKRPETKAFVRVETSLVANGMGLDFMQTKSI